MKLMIDTNILLDVLLQRNPFFNNSLVTVFVFFRQQLIHTSVNIFPNLLWKSRKIVLIATNWYHFFGFI